MKVFYCLIVIILSYLKLSLQEECTSDFLPEYCPTFINETTARACYFSENGTSVYDLCCQTCDSFKDPDALSGCFYGDMVLGCSEQNCTDPLDQGTISCCKTCRATFVEAANMTSTSSSSTSTTSTMPTTAEGVMTSTGTSTTQQSSSSSSSSSSSPTLSTTVPTATMTSMSTTTTQSTTLSSGTRVATSSSTVPSVAAAGSERTINTADTDDNLCVNPSVTESVSFCRIKDVCRMSFFGPICCIPCSEIEPEKCEDISRRCRTIRPFRCYTQLIKDRCCKKCQTFARGNSEECQYGDRFPSWCRARFRLSPQHTCTALDDLCCKTCKNFKVSTRRLVIKLPKSLRSLFRNLRKGRRRPKKSRKGSRRGDRRRSRGRGSRGGRERRRDRK